MYIFLLFFLVNYLTLLFTHHMQFYWFYILLQENKISVLKVIMDDCTVSSLLL